MRILAVDVGTGTQDILLFDTSGPVENCVKLVMPSATSIAAGQIRRATDSREAVVLTGVIQGGGPCHWALEDHLRTGYAAFATPEAAQTFDDDLDAVREMGIEIVGEDEAAAIAGVQVELRDLNLRAIEAALRAFDVEPEVEGYAVGCLDHGASPPGYSDRLFRFDHLRRVMGTTSDLRAFAYLASELPDYLTRARALVHSLPQGAKGVFLDTGPAAALGALQDPVVTGHAEQLVLNLGNMHALAFHLRSGTVLSLYEHHTGEMSDAMIDDFTARLELHTLRHDEVFESKGHGVFYATSDGASASRPSEAPFLTVTGPQRNRMRRSPLKPYFAAPHGDMMLSGCFGMLRGFAYRYQEHAEEIEKALAF